MPYDVKYAITHEAHFIVTSNTPNIKRLLLLMQGPVPPPNLPSLSDFSI